MCTRATLANLVTRNKGWVEKKKKNENAEERKEEEGETGKRYTGAIYSMNAIYGRIFRRTTRTRVYVMFAYVYVCI